MIRDVDAPLQCIIVDSVLLFFCLLHLLSARCWFILTFNMWAELSFIWLGRLFTVT